MSTTDDPPPAPTTGTLESAAPDAPRPAAPEPAYAALLAPYHISQLARAERDLARFVAAHTAPPPAPRSDDDEPRWEWLLLVGELLSAAAAVTEAARRHRPAPIIVEMARALEHFSRQATLTGVMFVEHDERAWGGRPPPRRLNDPGGEMVASFFAMVSALDAVIQELTRERGIKYGPLCVRDRKALGVLLLRVCKAARRSAVAFPATFGITPKPLAHCLIGALAQARPDLCPEERVEVATRTLAAELDRFPDKYAADDHAASRAALRAVGVSAREADGYFDYERKAHARVDKRDRDG